MPKPDRHRSFAVFRPDLLGCAVALLAWVTTAASAADPAPLRFSAPIEVRTPAPFVRIELPPSVYARVERSDLGDLRVVDSRGERVPFALLEPPLPAPASEREREAVLYPLPARPDAAGVWPSPVDIVVEGDRVSVSRHGQVASTAAAGRSGGWLIDTGERRRGEPAPERLRLRWSGPPEFTAAYAIDTSDDLRGWRGAGAGQLMALQAAAGALTQPLVVLPERPGRFVRLVWADAGAAPQLIGATSLAPERRLVAAGAAREIAVAASEPGAAGNGTDTDSRRGLVFDLGAALPVIDLDLRFASGTHVAPVRIQGRLRASEPWRELGGAVFFRIERDGGVAEAPAVALTTTLRQVRVVVDERAAVPAAAVTRLVVHAPLASLVFASQGSPPYRLLAGSRDAAVGALPVASLVPGLDDERARFGRAEIGTFALDPDAAAQAERAKQSARLRPWLLWGVLLAGVAVLGGLVWRLVRTGTADRSA